MKRDSFLSRAAVVIPALNEAPCVAATVRHWLDAGAALVRVVDNGSTDDTSGYAHEAGAEVLVEPRRGYGAAAWKGLQNLPPLIEWIVFSSADGSDQMTTTEMLAFTREMDAGAQLVLGERTSLPESRRHLSAVQRFGNWLCCWCIRRAWGHQFKDMASLRALRLDAVASLALEDRGFGWNVEMQTRALEEGLLIAEVPVRYHPRQAGTPKISGSFTGIVRAAWGIVSMMVVLLNRRSLGRQDGQQTAHALAADAVLEPARRT